MRFSWKSPAAQIAALLFIVLGLTAFTWAWEDRSLGRVTPPLDDTYIHLRFAWNLAHGGGFAFNPGRPLSGSTSPAWVLLLAPLTLIGRDAAVTGSVILSLLSLLAAPILTRRLGLRLGLSPALAFAAAAAVALNGRLLFAGFSGMETNLFAALGLALVTLRLDRAARGQDLGALEGALFGLATLVRPEGSLLFVIACAHYLAVAHGREGKWRLPITAVIAYAVAISPSVIFSLITTGHPLPATYVAKQADLMRERLRYLEWTARYMWLDNQPGALVFVAAALIWLGRLFRGRISFLAGGWGLTGAWPLGYLFASIVLTPMPYHFLRYQLPLVPFFVLLVAGLIGEAAGRVAPLLEKRGWTRLGRPETLRAALAAAWLVPAVIAVLPWPGVIVNSVSNIDAIHLKSADWLARASLPGEKIATMDIGAIGYFTDREVIDLVGLVTPEIVPAVIRKGRSVERSEAVAKFLAGPRPEYLAIFPDIYPGLMENLDFCTPVFQVKIDNNQISGSNWMLISRCAWPGVQE